MEKQLIPSTMNTRLAGYYWVKLSGYWQIANWNGASWLIFGSNMTKADDYFQEINPQPITQTPQP